MKKVPTSSRAGPKRVTIRHVAAAAGVSIGTASRAINGIANVDAQIKARVDRAVAKLGYEPDPFAQGMRGGATRTVGLMIRDIAIPSLAEFVSGVQDSLQTAGYTVVLACTNDQKAREQDLLRMMGRRRLDGLIMTTCSEVDPELIRARQVLPMPIVLLDRVAAGNEDSILLAHQDGMRQAMAHLMSLGHRRIGLITGTADVHPGRDRIKGYRDAFMAKKRPIDRRLIRTRGFDADSGFAEASDLLGLGDRPTAIVAGGVSILPGVLRATRARNLRIPRDISVIGCVDSDLSLLHVPAIAVIRWSYVELGRMAARMLLGRMSDETDRPPQHVVVPTEFVIRDSCGHSAA